jgi:phospholipid/cholesterol/gamma-HCH transport system substrate-binding protein
MKRAIREHSKDFAALVALILFAMLVGGYILSQQRQPYPAWVPFIGDDQFLLEVEMDTAQAVTPGQGQTVNMAGVEIGDIRDVELEDGRAIVTMGIEGTYDELIKSDASVLMRPRTGLQDMTMEIDPGVADETVSEGDRIPLSNSQANVMPDQILASLDGDTQNYLKLLVQGAGEGLGGNGEELSAGLRRFEPLGRYIAQINRGLAERRENIKRAVSSFGELTQELGRSDVRLADFVSTQNEVFEAFANQEAGIRGLLQELPSTLEETRGALASGELLANELGPASEALIPTVRAFESGQQSLQELARETVGPIRDQLRPFARQANPTLRHLAQGAEPLGSTVNSTTAAFEDLNRLFNAWAYNPDGPQEGHLFWTAWLNHNANNTARLQDAHGGFPRAVVMQACQTAELAEGLVGELGDARPFIWTLQRLTHAPESTEICPLDP